MRHMFIGVAAATAAYFSSGSAAGQGTSKADLTAQVRLAVDRGELLYIYDRAAWLGTDDIRDHYADLLRQAGGYVVSGDDSRTEFAFFDKSRSKAVYRATFSRGRLIQKGAPDVTRASLSTIELRMIKAKDIALKAFEQAKVGLCAKAMPNIAAIPSADPTGPIIVYLMTPQTDLKTYPLGGHFSTQIQADGSNSPVRSFTKSCIDMPMANLPKGATPAAFWITHLLDPTPTEVHVFTSLASKMPIIVGTSDNHIWEVRGSTIRSVPAK